jgi:mono/diheme cytochrome c family protein
MMPVRGARRERRRSGTDDETDESENDADTKRAHTKRTSVTEIPEHLLQRTRSRRQAHGLPVSGEAAGSEEGGGAAITPATGGAAPAAAAAGLPRGPVAPAGPVERHTPPPRPDPPYVQAYNARKKIPVWAMPALLALPLWAVFYAGTLSPPPATTLTQVEEGGVLFAANCSSCHGTTGGGGVGPQLAAGAVLHTFADPVDHVHWVVTGSAGAKGGVYGDTSKPSKGGMPSFGTSKTLTLAEIVDAVRYERETLSGEKFDEATAAKWAGLTRLVSDPDLEGLFTEADVEEILTEMSEQTGIPIEIKPAG